MANPGTFVKGEKKPNQGKRGPAKATKELKELILGALDQAGGVEYLVERANDPRTASAFLSLVGKVLPMQVTGGLTITSLSSELASLNSLKVSPRDTETAQVPKITH